MFSNEELLAEIEQIKVRNKKVEADKAWETSWTRKCVILLLTYLVITIFFFTARLSDPFINAIVPSLAFVISTSTLPLIKNWWMENIHKK